MNKILPGRIATLIKTPIRDLMNGKKYVFHHLQKCGGTSLKKSLSEYFLLKKDYAFQGEKRYNIAGLRPNHLLVGHFEFEDTQIFLRYPEICSKDYFLFTFIRDPLQLKISLYYYQKKRGWLNNDITLKDFVIDRSNYLSRLLFCNEDNYQEILCRYSFIGLVEEYNLSLEKLSLKINRNLEDFSKENVVPRDHEYQELIQDEAFKDCFYDLNSLDYKIYKKVKRDHF